MKLIGRDHDGAGQIFLIHFAQVVEDVGLEPRLSGSAAAALIDEHIVLDANSLRDEFLHFLQLTNVVAGVRHRERNAVRDVNDLDILLCIGGKLRESVAHAIFGGVDKSG